MVYIEHFIDLVVKKPTGKNSSNLISKCFNYMNYKLYELLVLDNYYPR